MTHRFTKQATAGAAIAASLLMSQLVSAETTQGVTKDQILIGTIQDLSGPVVGFSKEVLGGMRMRFDAVNAAGGIAGRKIKLIVEDSGYDTKKAMLAAQKLVQSDRVFIALGNMGTAITATTMPVFLEAGVISAFPTAATPLAFDPPSPMKYAFSLPYNESGAVMVRYLAKTRPGRKLCTLTQDDEFGQDLMRGVDTGAAAEKLPVIERTTYKRGATDFSSQVARMKVAGCDTVLLGTTLRETVAAVNEARNTNYKPDFFSSVASFSVLVPKLGGEAMNGIMAVGLNLPPDANGPTEGMRKWFAAYQAKFGEEPGQYSSFGYAMAGWIVHGLQGAGADLTAQRFNEAMERTPIPADDLGFAEMSFSKTKRLGAKSMRVYQLKAGKWVAISDFIQP